MPRNAMRRPDQSGRSGSREAGQGGAGTPVMPAPCRGRRNGGRLEGPGPGHQEGNWPSHDDPGRADPGRAQACGHGREARDIWLASRQAGLCGVWRRRGDVWNARTSPSGPRQRVPDEIDSADPAARRTARSAARCSTEGPGGTGNEPHQVVEDASEASPTVRGRLLPAAALPQALVLECWRWTVAVLAICVPALVTMTAWIARDTGRCGSPSGGIRSPRPGCGNRCALLWHPFRPVLPLEASAVRPMEGSPACAGPDEAVGPSSSHIPRFSAPQGLPDRPVRHDPGRVKSRCAVCSDATQDEPVK